MRRHIVPDSEYAQHIYENSVDKLVNECTIWLDLGCGRRLLPEWRRLQEEILITLSGS